MDDRPPKYQLINLKLDDDLDDFIARQRLEGLSFDKIARELWARTGISVTGATIANWHSPAEPTEAAS